MKKYLNFILNNEPCAVYKLDMPPSVNEAYSNSKSGRIKSKAYKRWLTKARMQMYGQKIIYFDKPIAIIHSLYVPDKRKRDCANYEKAATDFLVSIGVIADDSLVRLNVQQWMDWKENSRGVEIFIFSLDSCNQ